MNFRLFADELRNKLLLLGLREETKVGSFEIGFYYGNHPIITIYYNYEYILSLLIPEIDYFQSNIFREYYNDLTHVDDYVNAVSKYIKRKKQEAIQHKLKELEYDFEPSMWSQFVHYVHKLLRNFWSFLKTKGIWYGIAWYGIALYFLLGVLISNSLF